MYKKIRAWKINGQKNEGDTMMDYGCFILINHYNDRASFMRSYDPAKQMIMIS